MSKIARRKSAVGKTTLLASQLLQDYDYWLIKNYGKSGTYLTNAKTFLKSVKPGGTVVSQLMSYADGMSLTIQSFLRRFKTFLEQKDIQFIINDLNEKKLPLGNIYVKLFLLSRQDRLKGELSAATYATILNGFFNLIDSNLKSFNKHSAEKYILAPTLSDYTKRLYRSVLKAFCEWALIYQGYSDSDLSNEQRAVKRGLKLISAQSLREIISIKVTSGRNQLKRYHKDSLTERQRDKFLAACSTQRQRAIISLMAWNGLRTIEVIRLRVQDLNVKTKRIALWGKGRSAKNKDVIKLFQTPFVEFSKYIKSEKLTTGKVFPGITKIEISKLVHANFSKLKLKTKGRYSAHSLRHTAGQIMYDKGIPLEFIQKTLRHSSMETTLVYAQKAIDEKYFRSMPGNI